MLREPSIRDHDYMGEVIQEVNDKFAIMKITTGGSKVGEYCFVHLNRIWVYKQP